MPEGLTPGMAAAWALAIAVVVALYEGLVSVLFRSVTGWMPTAPAATAFLFSALRWGLLLAPAPLVVYALARAHLAGVGTARLWLLGWIAAVVWAAHSALLRSLLLPVILADRYYR